MPPKGQALCDFLLDPGSASQDGDFDRLGLYPSSICHTKAPINAHWVDEASPEFPFLLHTPTMKVWGRRFIKNLEFLGCYLLIAKEKWLVAYSLTWYSERVALFFFFFPPFLFVRSLPPSLVCLFQAGLKFKDPPELWDQRCAPLPPPYLIFRAFLTIPEDRLAPYCPFQVFYP